MLARLTAMAVAVNRSTLDRGDSYLADAGGWAQACTHSNEIVSHTGEAYVLGLDESLVAELEMFLDQQLQAFGPKTSAAAPTAAKPVQSLAVHPKFGTGVIVQEEGTGDQRKLTVDFEEHGRRNRGRLRRSTARNLRGSSPSVARL